MTALHSIHVGINSVDPAHYGTDAPLRGCENDARDMRAIATALGFEPQMLLTRQATAPALLNAVAGLKPKLAAGDTLLLTLACHGAQLKDTSGDEDDARDETWCMYDRMIIDDEVNAAFSGFKEGVRIVVVSDSCHSGSVVRKLIALAERGGLEEIDVPADMTFRCIEPFLDRSVFNAFLPEYARIKANVLAAATPRGAGPDVALLSGCQDNQTSGDLPTNGWFTTHLKKIWNGGKFSGDYRAFRQKISDSMATPTQAPNLFSYGPGVNRLLDERPFAPAKPGRTSAKSKKRTEDQPHQNGKGGSDMNSNGLHPSVVNIIRNGHGAAAQREGRFLGFDFDRLEGGCYVKIERSVLNGKSDAEVLQYFSDVIGPEMCSNYFTARDAFSGVTPRGGEVSCTASTGGGGSVSCTGTWRF